MPAAVKNATSNIVTTPCREHRVPIHRPTKYAARTETRGNTPWVRGLGCPRPPAQRSRGQSCHRRSSAATRSETHESRKWEHAFQRPDSFCPPAALETLLFLETP